MTDPAIKQYCRHGRRGYCRTCARERVYDLGEAAWLARYWDAPEFQPGKRQIVPASKTVLYIHAQLVESLGLASPRWQARIYEDTLMGIEPR